MKLPAYLLFILFFPNTPVAQELSMKISLDGGWLFLADSQKVGVEEEWFAEDADRSLWQEVQTPVFWEGYPGLANYDGWGWFARTFTFEKTAESMSIHFAGVDDDAVVWVNGVEVGSHTGYSDPFALDITAALRNGENLVVVQVMDYSGGGGIYRPMTLIETRYLDDLLKSEFFGTPALKSPEWVKDAVIYEVYLRSFSTEGTFAGLEKRIPELKKLGVTVVWLMPIHPVGAKNRKGRLGSPYAVQDYYGINPEFGTLREFKRLVTTVHKNGMKLIIDLVANHTSWDSKLMAEHPEWFTKDARGTIVPPNADWTDVADLDYAHPALRSYMIAMMRYWVKDVGIDGYRCDVAELVPTEFWNDARHQLNTIKPVMMLSEGSIPEHHAKAFDITYSWNIYDALGVLLMGKRPATLLDDILKNESLQFPTGSLRMRFTTNHDKNACDAPAIEKYGLPGLKLGVVLTFTMPGVPLIYNGEEVGNNRKLDLFEKVDIDWRRSREMGDLFASLARLRRDHKALTRGEMFRLASGHDEDVYAFVRMAGRDKVVVILNFANEPRFTTVAVPMGMVFPGRSQVTLKEHFGGIPLELNTENEQMELSLAPREFRIFVVEKE
jgi:hypothetical protein